MEMSNAMNE